MLSRQGRAIEAIEAYQRVLAVWPALPETWYNLAVQLRKAGRHAQALTAYQQALERGVKRPEEVHLNRAVIYTDDLRRDGEAERELQAALAVNPRYVPALLNLANLSEDHGRRESAIDLYERILEFDPDCAEALARLANVRTIADADDELIGRLRGAIADPRRGAADRASLGFALGRALDACGAYTAAFEAYSRANRDSRKSAPGSPSYDPRLIERLVDRLIAAFPERGRAKALTHVPSAGASPTAIFVCGMFRSGSTLTEQILSGHPRIVPGGELDLLPQMVEHDLQPYPEALAGNPAPNLTALAARYRSGLTGRFPGAEFVIDKRPDNFFHIGLIKSLFPGAKIVHTTRDPLDNCLSIFFLHLDQRFSYALDLMHIGHYYRQYLRLMSHWRSIHGDDLIEVNYDELVQNPRGVAARLLDFLGLEWDERCLAVPGAERAIKTASVWQVREPLYRRSSGRSRHYEKELAGLRAYLEPAANPAGGDRPGL